MTDAGHVRIPNRLLEAIIAAGFTSVQQQVVFAILRLTLGWNRQSVSASWPELAAFCDRKPSSGFRDAVKELVTHGVIVIASEGGGATSNGYGVQHDFERWGKFSTSTAKLSAVWSKRPEHADQLNLGPLMTLAKPSHPASPEAGSPAHTLPPQRQGACLPEGRGSASTEAGSPVVSDGAAIVSHGGKTGKTGKTTPHSGGRGEAMELLARIEGLREKSVTGQAVGSLFLRIDKVRDALGEDIAEALKLIGGPGRLIGMRPEHRGIVIGDLAKALERIRSREPKREVVG